MMVVGLLFWGWEKIMLFLILFMLKMVCKVFLVEDEVIKLFGMNRMK